VSGKFFVSLLSHKDAMIRFFLTVLFASFFSLASGCSSSNEPTSGSTIKYQTNTAWLTLHTDGVEWDSRNIQDSGALSAQVEDRTHWSSGIWLTLKATINIGDDSVRVLKISIPDFEGPGEYPIHSTGGPGAEYLVSSRDSLCQDDFGYGGVVNISGSKEHAFGNYDIALRYPELEGLKPPQKLSGEFELFWSDSWDR
jgi:hypothetical protein